MTNPFQLNFRNMSGLTTTPGVLPDAEAKDRYVSKLPGYSVSPLWKTPWVAATRPAPAASVALWKYEELRPLMLTAAQLINAKEAQRRVLILTNPSMKTPYTTDTITCGLQLLKPGEVAAAHRHRAFAVRFIIEGTAGFTSVNGERMIMEAGDMVLTPSWTWHDHGLDEKAKDCMIWLDANDLPLYHKLPVHFAENYPESIYPTRPTDNDGLFRVPWMKMKAQLDSQDEEYVFETYRKPDGAHISNTLGAHALRLKAGKTSTTIHTTCSFVFHTQAGSGNTVVEAANGEIKTLFWTTQDTFAIPAWSKIIHTAGQTTDAYLFSLSDMPLLENLDMYQAGEGKSQQVYPAQLKSN
ncbi:RmlC-like cupin domain-containing protein [Xylogone sp. PMI_703]|nr:RmlC-like cupin domain-containing protein [Xylogone sp. PMI_703]